MVLFKRWIKCNLQAKVRGGGREGGKEGGKGEGRKRERTKVMAWWAGRESHWSGYKKFTPWQLA